MDLKELVYQHISGLEILQGVDNVLGLLNFTNDSKNGDVTLPCFSMAKVFKRSPVEIGAEIVRSIDDKIFEKVENVNGYVNFFLNKKEIFKVISNDTELFNPEKIGDGKTVFVDFSSLNLAKYMHIGHLSTTVIGSVASNLCEFLGYNVVRLNYVGDYGTPFGKMITAIKKWGKEEEVETQGVDYVQDLYVKFNVEAENNPELMTEAREWFLKIENKDPEATRLYDKIIQVSIAEARRLCDELNITFDSWIGEAYYSDKMQPIIEELEKLKLLKESEGAKIVDLEKYNMGVCMIQKSDGASLYTTRDIATAIDRHNKYNFDLGLYVTSTQQNLHFARFFKVLEMMGKSWALNLKHINYGTYSLPTGKIGSRFGKQALVKDMLEQAINKAKEVIINKGTKETDVDKLAREIGIGAVKFGVLKTERIKDCVFDLENSLNFDGETSPYMQYTFARCNSIIEKAGTLLKSKVDTEDINNVDSFELIKHINNFNRIILDAYKDFEPCYISRYLINLCSLFNKFYNNHRIIDNDMVSANRLKIVDLTRQALDKGLMILGIDRPNCM